MAEENTDEKNCMFDAEGEDNFFPEGEFMPEGEGNEEYIFDGEGEGEFIHVDDYYANHSEEAMAHSTNEEDKKTSEIDEESFHVEDMSSGAFHEHGDHIYAISQHPTMRNIMLSGGGDDRILVWDIEDEEKQKNTLCEIKEGFKDSIEYIKFNHDGKYLLVTGQGNPIRIYKCEEVDGKPTFDFKIEMETGDDISFITWHHKANLFLTGGNDMMIWMFNALNGEFSTFTGHEDVINNAQFSPDGKNIISISNDCNAKVWNPRTGKWIQTIKNEKTFHQSPITAMFLINDSMVSGDEKGYIYISQFLTGETVGPISKHSGRVESISGNSAVSIAWGSLDGVIKIIDLGKQCMSIETPQLDDQSGVTQIKSSKSDPIIFVSSVAGSMYWIDTRNGEVLKKFTAHRDTIMDFVIDEDQKKIVTVGDDKMAYVFDM